MPTKITEPVFVRLDAANVPVSFRWRGLVFHIDVIDRVWRQSRDRRRDQRIYRVRSDRRSFVLHHDRRLDRWTVVKSPWQVRFGFTLSGFAARMAS